MYCNNDLSSICSVCAGKILAQYRKGVSAVLTGISASILTLSLKKMHSSVKHLVKTDINDMIC